MFAINLQSREPIYEQLYKNVVRLISLNILKPDEKLPAVRALALQLGVNPNTVSKAYQNLEKDGITYTVSGKGTFVASNTSAATSRKKDAITQLLKAAENAVLCGVDETDAVNTVKKTYKERNVK